MTCNKPLLYVVFLTGIYACGGHSTKPPETASVQPASPNTTDTVATFTWSTEVCELTGRYNPQLFSAEQLKNTYDLWFGLSGMQLENEQTVFNLEDIKKLNLKILTSEYEKKREQYGQMKIVDLPFWRTLKEQRMRELDDQYELAKLCIQAFSDPSVLTNNRFAKTCRQYVTALTSPDTGILFTAWKVFAEEQKTKNGSPDKYMEGFYEKYNSPEKVDHAKIALITFGWGNCANQTLTHLNRDEKMETEYNKLFTDIKTACEEP